jgi:hypothetical protein
LSCPSKNLTLALVQNIILSYSGQEPHSSHKILRCLIYTKLDENRLTKYSETILKTIKNIKNQKKARAP